MPLYPRSAGRHASISAIMQLTLNKTYENHRPVMLDLLSRFETEGVVLYNARNQIRQMKTAEGRLWVVKRFKQPKGLQRLVYSFFRMPKSERAYRNALRLKETGIPTPEAVGYAIEKKGLIKESYLITRPANLSRDFYEFRYHDAAGYEDIIESFAQLVATMHRKGIYHLDLSPGNILFDKQNGQIRFAIIDVNRMRFGKPVGIEDGCRNFCRLWGRMDFIETLGKAYAAAQGWEEQDVTQKIVHEWKKYWHIKCDQDIEKIFDRNLKR